MLKNKNKKVHKQMSNIRLHAARVVSSKCTEHTCTWQSNLSLNGEVNTARGVCYVLYGEMVYILP